ncbi:BRO-N domain-containing protein [Metapseudomonas otitidis]|nr:BRO family protein [Pseudomonas otitidis]
MAKYTASVNEVDPSEWPVVDHQGQPHCAPSNVIPFRFEEKQVRTLLIGDQPWFVAKDIVCSLGYAKSSSPAKLIEHVPEQWKGVNPIHTLGGTQRVLMLSEQGLYFFLGRSDKPKALPVQMWVAGEVLPAIRKHGRYEDTDSRLATLVGQTIGTDGFHCLAAVLDGKVRHLPAKLRVGAKNHVWSQVRKAFSVSAVEDIPGSAMDSVRNFIAAYALEGEWIPRSEKAAAFADLIGRQLGASERWLVFTDGRGAEQYQQIPTTASVMSPQMVIEGICRGDYSMSTSEMFDLMASTLAGLKLRSDNQQHQLDSFKSGRSIA